MRRYNQGWKQESERHSLAARKVKTGRKVKCCLFSPLMAKGESMVTVMGIPMTENQYLVLLHESQRMGSNSWNSLSDEERKEYIMSIKRQFKSLTSKGFSPNSDDKVHEKAFEKDEERVSSSLTPEKVDYLIKDEHKATKEYKGFGLESLSHDEARHEYLLKKLKKENKMPLASHGKKVHTAKFDRCVKEVSKKSKGKVNPYAVCSKSLGYEKSVLSSHRRK